MAGKTTGKCGFVEQVPQETEYRDEVSGEVRKTIIPQPQPCENPADGFNGFCKNHSYVILASITKEIEEEITENIMREGKIHSLKYPKTTRRIFNIGENLPVENFSNEEIAEYLERGRIAIRTGQDTHEKYDNMKELTDIEISETVSRPASEIERFVKTNKISTQSLEQLKERISDDSLKKVIKEKIDGQRRVFNK